MLFIPCIFLHSIFLKTNKIHQINYNKIDHKTHFISGATCFGPRYHRHGVFRQQRFAGPTNISGPPRAMTFLFLRFLNHTQQRTTVSMTPLDELSARRRDLFLTTHNTHNRQASMPLVVFEPTISAGERPQTYALDRAATGTIQTEY